MSAKSFSAFREKLATDATLRDEMSRALGSAGTTAALVAFARARGYDIDADDVKSAVEQLSDDELDAVTGGTATLMRACAKGTHIKEIQIE